MVFAIHRGQLVRAFINPMSLWFMVDILTYIDILTMVYKPTYTLTGGAPPCKADSKRSMKTRDIPPIDQLSLHSHASRKSLVAS